MNRQLNNVTDLIASFPGIGRKSAARIAFFLLRQPEAYITNLIDNISDFYTNTEFCPNCSVPIEKNSECSFCTSTRDQTSICVVEQPPDAYVIEASGDYHGLYHVLMGCLSPLEGVGPEDLRFTELYTRIKSLTTVTEVIVATNPSIEGNATAHYIAEQLEPFNVQVTRIATGMALGSQLEYTDSKVVSQALNARTPL